MRRIAVTALLAGLALSAPARADPGEVSCQRSAAFLVVGRERTDDVGTDVLARPRIAGATDTECRFEPQPDDFRIGSPTDAYHVNALRGDHLILEDSTGPAANLVIYNLSKRAKVLDVPVGDDVATDAAGVTYWEKAAEGSAANCRDFAKHRKDGFGSRIETRTRFLFATEAPTRGRETRCVPTQ